MYRLRFVLVLAFVLIVAGAFQVAEAQIQSEFDTLMIMDAFGNAGDTVAVDMYLTNTIEVGGLNFLLRFDSTYLSPAYAWDAIIDGDTAAPLHYELINRGAGKFFYAQSVNSLDTSAITGFGHIVTGIFVGDPFASDDIAIGNGTFLRFYVYIKPNAPQGTSIDVILYDEQVSGGRQNEFYDPEGLIGVLPTLVTGSVTVGEGPPPQDSTNTAPYFTQPTQTVHNVDQGDPVQFTVTGADVDVGQPITLSMLSGPSGASFSGASGTGSVSSVFSWTPNFSQAGQFQATFIVEDDSTATAQRVVTINVSAPEVEDDILFTTSQETYFVEGGIPGADDVSVPINLNDLNTLFGVQFDLSYDNTVMVLDSFEMTDRLAGFELYTENTGPGMVRVISFGLANEEIGPPVSSSAILNCWFSINQTAAPGYYKFKLDNGRASVSPDPGQGSVDILVDTLGAVAVDAIGDVNLDTRIDVDDLVKVVAYIIGDYPLSTRQFRAGNINGDTEVNVVDLVGIINMIFAGASPTSLPKFAYTGEPASLEVVAAGSINDQIDELRIDANLPTEVAGLQFDLTYDPYDIELGDPGLTERSYGFRLRSHEINDGRLRVLLYFDPSDMGNVIDAGLGSLVTIPVYQSGGMSSDEQPVKMHNVVLSTPDGREIPVVEKSGLLPTVFELKQNYPNPFNPTTNISFAIGGGEAQPVKLVIYNVLGQTVSTLINSELTPGQYDVTWDGTSSDGESQASGVYFYSLQVGDRRDTKKMVLSK
jgi:hypothetical protein